MLYNELLKNEKDTYRIFKVENKKKSLSLKSDNKKKAGNF
jgi:hypothetical protein